METSPPAPDSDLSRRRFLRRGTALAVAAAGVPLAASAASPVTMAPRPSGPAAAARRRNLFNGDCNFFFYNPELWQPEGGPYRAEAIHRYVRAIAASGVDALLVNPNTQVAWYPSRTLPHILDGYRRGDAAFARSIAAGAADLTEAQIDLFTRNLVTMLDLYLDLHEGGVDWLAEAARACRAAGISPWLRYRMNATHFSLRPDSPVNAPVFRDPANRLSGRVPGPAGTTHPSWIGLNFAQPAVRAHMHEMIREGIQSYDYEGIELDWLRHPVCVEAPASPAATAALTDWTGELKALAQARRADVPLGLRLPANLAYLRSVGLDVREMVRQGFVDFVTFSNYWQTSWETPLDVLRRELGPDVVIYGGIEDAPNWLEALAPSLTARPLGQELQLAGDNAYRSEKAASSPRVRGTRYLSASAPFLRANAAGKLALGADGVATFNFFVTDQVRVPDQRADYAALRELSDLGRLRGLTKHYAFNSATKQAKRIWDVPEQLPVSIPPGLRRSLRLPMCAEPVGRGLRLIVQVVTAREGATVPCGVSLNGGWPSHVAQATQDLLFPSGPYSRHVDEHAARNYELPVDEVRDGWNEITLHNDGAEDLRVIMVELAIVVPSPASPS